MDRLSVRPSEDPVYQRSRATTVGSSVGGNELRVPCVNIDDVISTDAEALGYDTWTFTSMCRRSMLFSSILVSHISPVKSSKENGNAILEIRPL